MLRNSRKSQSDSVRRLIAALDQPVLIFNAGGLLGLNRSGEEMLGVSEGHVPEISGDQIISPLPPHPPPDDQTAFTGRLITGPVPGTMINGRAVDLGDGLTAWTLDRGGALADLGALTAGWIHNLAGPLSVVRSTAELLEHIFGRAAATSPGFAKFLKSLPPTASEGMQTIIDAVDQASQSAGDLMARIQGEASLSEMELDLNAILASELEFMRGEQRFKYEIQVTTSLDPALPRLRGVYSDFSQSLRNLLLNAVEAMDDSPDKNLEVATNANHDSLDITIIDSGSGIAEEMKSSIFEPFVTTKSEARGACGLGLHSVKQLLKPYRPAFDIDSRPGRTSFRLTLPV